jgi:hypothetical protein
VLASAQGLFDEAEQHLATFSSVVRDFAMPRGEAGCVTGFAKIALDRGDYARASRLLAAVEASMGPGETQLRSFDALLYAQCSKDLRDVIDPETARTTEARGAVLSVKEALDAELMRSGTTAVAHRGD